MSGRYKMKRRYPYVEGWCAECGAVKVTNGMPAFQHRTHQGVIPCAFWWHDFLRKYYSMNMRALMRQRLSGFRN